ncbi:MAG: sulfatase-like hydrolase/transferase [Planctomycetes bacterium]|nr:sulfatase-like hydrolase/transferase [Planctomycetota bacterium]
MTRTSTRQMLRTFFTATAVIGTMAAAAERADTAEQPQPNIVLAMADDQGWGDAGYMGHPVLKTPVLDQMAANGLRFDRFYAAAPVCSPTRGSVLTGRHPNRFGCFSWGYSLRPQEITVAESLKQAGYVTGHFGKWHLGSVRPDSTVCPGASGFDEWFSSPNFFDNDPLMCHNGKVVRTKGESSLVTMDAALAFIRRCVQRRQRFLAVVWFGSPHSPHRAADEFKKLYPDQPKALQNYYGEISGIDAAMGRLRRELRRLGIAENTLVWYCSDNGATKRGSTGGLSGYKGTLLEGGIRVPAIIEWPERIKEPRRTDAPCGTVDIYPTLLDLVGVRIPHQPPLDGISLMPLIDGKMAHRDKPLGFWVYPAKGIPTRSTQLLEALMEEQTGERPPSPPPPDPGRITRQYPEDVFPGPSAWIDGRYKLHRRADASGQATYQLFDLVADPRERHDLSKSQPKRLAHMKADLESWLRSVVRSLNGKDYQGQLQP